MSDEHDSLLTETIARHFPKARVDGNDIDLGFGGLSIGCRVNDVGEIGGIRTASLFFLLSGSALGDAPVFASMGGYGDSDHDAIVSGGCNWACSFGPVLRAGLAAETNPKVECFDVTADGQGYRLFVDGIDRRLTTNGRDQPERTRVARARLGGWPWLSRLVVESGRLPLLSVTRSTLLSVFVASRADGLIVEVKVDGVDWPGMAELFAAASNEPPGAIVLLRELAVLVPVGPAPPLKREAVERTLAGLQHEIEGERRRALKWRGWHRHGGVLGAAMPDGDVARLESEVGPLPPDYRHFLTEIAGSGAGPGYGLLPPTGEAQQRLSQGRFAFEDASSPDGGPAGVLALAHAGCGIVWYLVLRGPRAGEVWCDARSSDGEVRRVAASFTEWYRGWLDAAVGDRAPWSTWRWRSCATASVLAQLLEKVAEEEPDKPLGPGRLSGMIAPGKLRLTSGGSRCFAPQAPLDPCEGCVGMAVYQGLDENVFPAGVPPLEGQEEAGPTPVAPPGGGGLARWLRRLKGG